MSVVVEVKFIQYDKLKFECQLRKLRDVLTFNLCLISLSHEQKLIIKMYNWSWHVCMLWWIIGFAFRIDYSKIWFVSFDSIIDFYIQNYNWTFLHKYIQIQITLSSIHF